MLKTMRLLMVLVFCALTSVANAQTYTGLTWGLDRTSTPYTVGINNNGAWKPAALFNSSGIAAYYIGSNVEFGSNFAQGALAVGSPTAYSWMSAAVASVNSVAIGKGSLGLNTTGTNNVAVGTSASASNTTGHDNTVVGNFAGYLTTTGFYNTAVGGGAVFNNTIGIEILGVGFNAAAGNVGGSFNIGVGNASLNSSQNDTQNVGFGHHCLYVMNGGSYNTCLGNLTFSDLTTGDANTGLGYNTGLGVTTGSNNTIVGANVSGLAAGLSNSIILAIGDGSIKADYGKTTALAWTLDGAFTVKSASNPRAGYAINAATTDPWAQLFLGTSYLGIGTGATHNAIVGAVVQDGTNGASFPTGVTGYAAQRNAGNTAFGFFGRADAYAAGDAIGAEINSFNFGAAPNPIWPPNKAFGTPDVVPIALTLAAGGTQQSHIALEISREGSAPNSFLSGTYVHSNAVTTYGYFQDATATDGPFVSMFVRNSGAGATNRNLHLQMMDATPDAAAKFILAWDSASAEVFSVGVGGVVTTAGGVQIAGVAIAALGTCNTAARGMLKWVDDTVASAAPTFHATVAGGGATTVHSLVSCDGTNWVWN